VIVPCRAPSEAATVPVNWSLSDHGNGLGRGARGSGGSGGSGGNLVVGRGGGAAAAAAVALAPAPALSAMRRGSSERELAARWEMEAVAEAKAEAEARARAAVEQVRVDAGAAGEPEGKAEQGQPRARAPARPRAAEEGDARGPQRPPRMLPQSKPKGLPAPARGLGQLPKPRDKGRGCKRSSGCPPDERAQRAVTVDSSKARTSLDALKISIRQLKWKEVRSDPAAWAQGGGQDDLRGPRAAQALSSCCASLTACWSAANCSSFKAWSPKPLPPGQVSHSPPLAPLQLCIFVDMPVCLLQQPLGPGPPLFDVFI
jgi:hypothetical protein